MQPAEEKMTQISFWKDYGITMRPYLLFISGSAGMAGFVLGTRTGWGIAVPAFISFFLAYGFGQALTDCFQMDTDSLSAPYRPLVQGRISRRQVLIVSSVGLSACCLILCLLNPWTLWPGLAGVFGLMTYTLFKRRWWGGPLYNAWIVALLPFMGFLSGIDSMAAPISQLFSQRVVWMVLGTFFSYANFVLMGYFKDISADRNSGYRTFVVVFGWKASALVCDVLALFAVICGAGFLISGRIFVPGDLLRLGAWLCFLGAVAALLSAQVRIHLTRDEKKAYGAIVNVVRGFVLLRLTEICFLRPSWIFLSVVFYLLFEWIMRRRPEREQV